MFCRQPKRLRRGRDRQCVGPAGVYLPFLREAYQNNFADNGITRSVKIKELEFDGQGKLSEGCMLILEVEQKKGDKLFTLSPVPLNEIIHFMQDTWRYC